MLNSLINLIWKFRRDEFEKKPEDLCQYPEFFGIFNYYSI